MLVCFDLYRLSQSSDVDVDDAVDVIEAFDVLGRDDDVDDDDRL